MEIENNHIFYVLECCDGTLYGGYTNNLEKRVRAHNFGKGAKYTRGRVPVKAIHFEQFETKREAMQAEYTFKQLSRKNKLLYLQKKGTSH